MKEGLYCPTPRGGMGQDITFLINDGVQKQM
jgi:hypothetical protein